MRVCMFVLGCSVGVAFGMVGCNGDSGTHGDVPDAVDTTTGAETMSATETAIAAEVEVARTTRCLDVSPSDIAFKQLFDTTTTRAITLIACGNSAVTITAADLVDLGSSSFELVLPGTLPLTITPDEAPQTLTIRYHPAAPAALDAHDHPIPERTRLHLTSDADRAPTEATISGVSYSSAQLARPTPIIRIAEDFMVSGPTTFHLDASDSWSTTTIVEYAWTVEGPGNVTFAPDNAQAQVTLSAAEPGRYTVTLEVLDATEQTASASKQRFVVDAHGVRFELSSTLSGPTLPPGTGPEIGPDFDLHLSRDDATAANWFDPVSDCYFGHRTPDWGVSGDIAGDPSLASDSLHAAIAEEIVFPMPTPGACYRVGVNVADDWGDGPSPAAIRIFSGDSLLALITHPSLAQGDMWWASTLCWPLDEASLKARTVCADTRMSCGSAADCGAAECVPDVVHDVLPPGSLP